MFKDKIFALDSSTEGAMYCPVILGSDKTTVLVATGQVEYHPVYLSIGNPHNSVWHAHWNAVIPIAFLPIPKCKWLNSSVQHAHHLLDLRRSQARWQCTISEFQMQTVSCVIHCHSRPTSPQYNCPSYPQMSWWTFQTHDLRSSRFHCWLPRTSNACGDCPELVPKVSD